MDRLLEKLWDFVARSPSQTLQIRLFRLICLTVGILCLVVVLPVNLFQNLPAVVNIADVVLGLFALYCYRASCRGRHFIITFLVVLVLLMDPTWFQNAGSQGSISFYFFPALLFPMVLCRGRARWVLSGLLVINLVALLLLEYYFPSLTVPFQRPTDRLLDLISGVVCSCLCMVVIVWVILANYDWEQKLLSRYARDLATSEQNYREVVENAQSIILRVGTDGRVRFFNRFAEQLFGFKREEIIGQHVVGTIVPAVSAKGEKLAEKVAEILTQPQHFGQVENENICRDGRRIRVNWTNQPILDDQGRLQEVLCVGTDVTERSELLEKLQLTQATMDAAAEQIVWLDGRGGILYANAAVVEAVGLPLERIYRLTLQDLLEELSPAVWAQHWQALKEERAITFECHQKGREGRTRPVELSLTYMRLDGKEYATAFLRDLTERKLAEEKRLHHEQQLLQLQKLESLGILAGGIAHDFNNLLTAILGNVSLAKLSFPAGTEEYESLGEAEKASLQAKDLTARLLTFSKGGKPVKSAIALEKIVRESTERVLRGSSATCQSNLPEDLWVVEADPAQLAQVFHNLLRNAQQAMPGGGRITIEAGNRELDAANHHELAAGRYVQVVVRDEGVGISEEVLPKIFDPYFTTRKAGGGLGLAVVHSIIKYHHGVIKVASQVGRGTTFTLLLPAAKDAATARLETQIAAPARARRILVMDDEDMVRKALCKMLARLGYEVEAAEDGAVAVELFRAAHRQARHFDLVIMDLTVPGGMGGQEAIQQIRKIDPLVKAIVSSGYSDSPVMSDYQAHGFAAVVVKPYTTAELQSVLNAVAKS